MNNIFKTDHITYNGETNTGYINVDGIEIKFNCTIPAGDKTKLILAYNNNVTGKIKRGKYPELIQELNNVKTFIANYQYCYK